MGLVMEKEKIYYNALSIVTEGNLRFLERGLKETGSFSDFYKNFFALEGSEKYRENFKKIEPEREYEKMRKLKIELVLREEENFPELLKEIQNPPLALYYKTNLSLDLLKNKFTLSIVGTRKATNFGKEIAKKFAYEIASVGGIIVSGLALGIDRAAHLGCLEGKGETIAVLARGLDEIYPPSNRDLGERILNSGILISEFPIGFSPLPYNFLSRNRIISGLSYGVLVVEAPEKSGALITANFALSQNREVFAIPGSINNKNYLGSNKLIQKGAKLVLSLEDILEEIKEQVGLEIISPKEKIEFSDQNQKKIYFLLRENPEGLTVDKISEILNLKAEEILSSLSILELNNLVKETGGRWIVI